MIVHVALFLESIGGSIDYEPWLRPVIGRQGMLRIAGNRNTPINRKKKWQNAHP